MGNTYCIFSALYSPHVGGIEAYTQNLARELTAAGNQVVVVTNKTSGGATHQHAPEADVYRLPCIPFMNGRFPITKRTKNLQDQLDSIARKQIDFVIVNTRFYPLSILGASFANEHGVVPIVIDHGSAHLTVGNTYADLGIQRVEHAMTNRIKKYDARFYGVSKKSVQWLRHFGIQGEGVLHNAIDAPEFRKYSSNRDFRTELGLNDEAFLVAFTGRLAPEKGVLQLAEAAVLLEKDNVHVLMAGDGALHEQLARDASPNLHLLGPLGSPDVSALLLTCSAFCMPTRSEGFSTSLLEAAACGLTPVITDVGGVDELIPSDEYGLVLPDNSPETIAGYLLELSSNRTACQHIGNTILHRVESDFTWKRTAEAVTRACETAQR